MYVICSRLYILLLKFALNTNQPIVIFSNVVSYITKAGSYNNITSVPHLLS
jgi:hypothetical protein